MTKNCSKSASKGLLVKRVQRHSILRQAASSLTCSGRSRTSSYANLFASLRIRSVQMAAFVNSNEAVDIIKGYIPRKCLEYYTNITGISETKPKLPKGQCCDELYALLTKSVNYSPIRILKAIMHSSFPFGNCLKIIRTLDARIENASFIGFLLF